ncbi:MAG: heparan-alpha-glucosaminide N-acetyltransferase domain-containing protein [Bryobacteraceae bacterium]|nr:heparan-alpha-glucosaminide N-acetyltransferase domain-containing protein [Bryobacteraceae bacterium]
MQARYHSVDALRGLIMILMAIDHASAIIARQHSSEFWAGAMSSYTSPFPFLTRWVTHLCAPGFFLLMGAGIYWFAASRREAGWTQAAILRRTAVRGLAIFLTAQFLESPLLFLQSTLKPAAVSLSRTSAPLPNDGTAVYWGLITLSGLGLVMIACAGLLPMRPWMWLVCSALCVFATNSLLPASGQPGPLWQLILLAPGLSRHLIVVYPVIPWLAGAAAGMYFAHWWRTHPGEDRPRIWIAGAALLATGLALRTFGGWGNIRPPRDSGWIEFLNNVKYPPSLVFWTMSLGIDLLLLALLTRLPERWKAEQSPLIVFGQTPLFFYLAHFYLLTLCAFVFYRDAGSLEHAYLMWALVLVALSPACLRYRSFQSAKPAQSLWRLF